MNLAIVGKAATRFIGRTGLILKHSRPEIFMVGGIIGVGVTVVVACRATLKLEEVLDASKAKMDQIKETAAAVPEEYSEADADRDKTTLAVKTAINVAKLYTPAFIIGVVSIGFIVYGNRVLRKENAALTAAYMGISEAFKRYRARVVESEGQDKDREYRYGIVKKEVEETAEDGTIAKKITTVAPKINEISEYARYFDETNPNWKKNPELTLMFLRSQQNYANDLLHSKGHLFLNEVYDLLNLPRTEAGQYVGWIDGMGDGFIDFGIYDIKNEAARNFVNGYEQAVLLDFNVDGPIMQIFTKVYGPEYSEKVLDEKKAPVRTRRAVKNGQEDWNRTARRFTK